MFIETQGVFSENRLFEKLQNALEQMEKNDYTFHSKMVLMWFNLSTGDSKVCHVISGQCICPSRRFQQSKGCACAIRLLLGELQWPNIDFIWKIALQQVSYSIYIPVLVRKFDNQVHVIECKITQACRFKQNVLEGRCWLYSLFATDRTGSTRIPDLNKNSAYCCMPRSWTEAILIQISDPSWSGPICVPACLPLLEYTPMLVLSTSNSELSFIVLRPVKLNRP